MSKEKVIRGFDPKSFEHNELTGAVEIKHNHADFNEQFKFTKVEYRKSAEVDIFKIFSFMDMTPRVCKIYR